MSNLLLDSLPETVAVDGKEYFIDTDFRTCIIFEKVIMGSDADEKKLHDILELFYPEGAPPDYNRAFDEIVHLYRCGAPPKPAKTRKKNGEIELKPQMIYDYEHDAGYIFAAFLTQYGIDLTEIAYLHWWKFQALFRSLETHNKIVEIMGYREADLSKIKSRDERSRIASMKRLYALPQSYSFEEKVAMAGAAFAF